MMIARLRAGAFPLQTGVSRTWATQVVGRRKSIFVPRDVFEESALENNRIAFEIGLCHLGGAGSAKSQPRIR